MKGLAAIAVLLGLAVLPAGAAATTIPVSCAAGGTGVGTAINQANAASGADTVSLARGCTYTFTQGDFNGGWYGTSALPPIASDITIQGNGAKLFRASSTPATFRFFFVGANPSSPSTSSYVTPGAGKLTLRDLTLQGGLARGGGSNAGGGGAGLGGAIFNQGTLVIDRSTLTGNQAIGGPADGSSGGLGGGGLGPFNSNSGNGGGMGGISGSPGGTGGTGNTNGGGGGAGLATGENGGDASSTPGQGGGPRTGTGGFGTGIAGGMSGDGSGGGGTAGGSGNGRGGGRFGNGGDGFAANGGGGGGVGGGGGAASPGSGGGGGFGGGGGWGIDAGGDGGFGGGGGATGASGTPGTPGFGGGTPTATKGGGGAGLGGAVFNMQGTVVVTNSTFAGNSVAGGTPADTVGQGMGGAVFNMSGGFTATGSTFAQNSATDRATSIYNLVYDGFTLRQARITLQDTIVARGTGAPEDVVSDARGDNNPPLAQGTADASVGQRDIVQTTAVRNGGTITGSPLTGDPLLGPLAANGGLTPTMAPRAGSPAIDAGLAFGLTTDQRGLPRPSGPAADIGAVELQVPVPPKPAGPGAFGKKTLVTLSVGKRIGKKGPVTVVIRNGNGFAVTGKLSTRSTRKFGRKKHRRYSKLKSKTLSIKAHGKKTIKLSLTKNLRTLLRRKHKIGLLLSAAVKDPAGHKRTVRKKTAPRLKVKKKKKG